MLFNVLIVFLSNFVHLVVSENTYVQKCCIVSAYDLGMIVYYTAKENVKSRSSTTRCGVQLKTFKDVKANYEHWIVKSSNEESKINLVLDQRWESLPNRITGDITSTYLSLKPSSNSLENLDCQENQWCHIFVEISRLNSTYYTVKDTNKVDKQVKKENILENNVYMKIHKHNYLWTNLSTNTIIYENKNFPTIHRKTCISLYLAMCKECNLTIIEKETNTQKNVTGNDTWTREHLCSNFSEQLTIQVSTFSQHENRYWAIGDIFYFNCSGTNESEILGQRNISLIPNESKCEDANNNLIEPQNCYEEEKEDLPTSKTPNTSLFSDNNNNNGNQNGNESQASIKLLYLLLIIPAIAIPSVIFYFCKLKKVFFNGALVIPSDSQLVPREFELLEPLLRTDKMITTIKLQDFENYVKAAFDPQNTGVDLDKQFSTFPAGYLRSYVVGRQPENLKKNKYPKIVPYDDNRVILGRNLGDNFNLSEYINASYVEGSRSENEYIVSQNPLSSQQVSTVIDFWRMIWQENIQFVVMITDSQKKNFAEYWPSLNRTIDYGGISVTLKEIQEHTHFTERLLIVNRFGFSRKIKQYHYVSWMDSDQIMYAHTLVAFINKLLEIPHEEHPILVHCEAGTGRCGVVILCDIALRLAPITGSIDIYKIVGKLRNCRFELIQNVNQYKLAHLVILEHQNYKQTALKICQNFPENVLKLLENQSQLLEQWDYLEQLMSYDKVLSPHVYLKQHHNKNRYEDKFPEIHSRVVLKYITPDYINASYVSSYRQANKFIVTQQPMPQTLTDFWIMVLQHNVTTIVNLNEIDINKETYCLFWPTANKPILKPCADITVEYKEKVEHLHYEKIIIKVQEEARHRITITVFSMKDWHSTMTVPNSPDELLQLYDDLMYPKQLKLVVIITCSDGITASGLFVCLAYLLSKMHQEKQCDLLESIRTIRHSHDQFINIDQFKFLYRCVMTYYNKQL